MPMIRLGEINFINALPLKLTVDQILGVPVQPVSLSPKQLNQQMLAGHLDVSAVSSAFYLRHQSQLTLLEGVSISAESPVESVLLFLPQGLTGLKPNQPVAVPDSSETSIALMQYMVYRQTGLLLIENLEVYTTGQGQQWLDRGVPVLAIGNEALTLKTQFPLEKMVYIDLAQAWQETLNLPFVFAVWVAQNDWARNHPEHYAVLNQQLIRQKTDFLNTPNRQAQIVLEAHQRCPHLSIELLTRYFTTALSYNLDQNHHEALTQFDAILKWLDDDATDQDNWNRTELSFELLHR